MAFSFGGENGRRGRRFSGPPALSEINVVPLVDVVLVLLIIFMITANVMEFGLDIQVPKVKMVRETAQELPVVSITKTGESYLNDKPVNINLLADKETSWDPIAQIVAELGEAKFEVKMVTAPIDSASRRRR